MNGVLLDDIKWCVQNIVEIISSARETVLFFNDKECTNKCMHWRDHTQNRFETIRTHTILYVEESFVDSIMMLVNEMR